MKMSLAWFLTFCVVSGSASASTLDELVWLEGDIYYQTLHESIVGGELDKWAESIDLQRYDESNWRSLVTLEAAELHRDNPKLVDLVYNLESLKAEVYFKTRLGRPWCGRELARLPDGLVPVMIELYLRGLEGYGYSSPDHRDIEEEALRLGLIRRVASTQHPAVYWFLLEVAEGLYWDEASWSLAIGGLGRSHSADAFHVLRGMFDEAEGHGQRRAEILRAIGKQQSVEAWRFIEPILRSSAPDLQRAAIHATQAIGAHYGWRGTYADEEWVRAAAGSGLIAVLPRVQQEMTDRVLEALSSVSDSTMRRQLHELLSRKDLTARERQLFGRALSRVELALARR